jgi:F-box protein 11
MCNRSKIAYNTIRRNSTGIEYSNSDPIISNNLITLNKKDGLVSKSRELIRCSGEVKFNVISENDEAGIRCTGTMNEAYIFSNTTICFNKKCGILIQNGANPHIFKNLVEKNLGQGILIMEGSSAFIEKNEICNNIKSNIALGGKGSINTTIVENNIHSSRCEGIFTIYG